jgi:hypothetical protein
LRDVVVDYLILDKAAKAQIDNSLARIEWISSEEV